MPYDFFAGGSGASMRTSCIGLAYNGTTNRGKLVSTAIETSRITHNSAIGYLGGLTSALFTAYAIENISIEKWPFLLMDLFNYGTINQYINYTKRDVPQFSKDSHVFIKKWSKYTDDKFDESGKPIMRRTNKNLVHRTKYYHDNFSFEHRPEVTFPGSGGDDSVIIAYDCLLDAGKSWEKLVVYSMLHGGDTDTTGCIAGSWYGALYGFGDVPMHRIEKIENKLEIEELGIKIFEKFKK